jgi:acyl-CoA thioesterase
VRQAFALYTQASLFFVPISYPTQYATTRNNLGNAYIQLPAGTPEESALNVCNAIACYSAALEIRKRDQYPTDYATTQNNLGAAYQPVEKVSLTRVLYFHRLLRMKEDRWPSENASRAIRQNGL